MGQDVLHESPQNENVKWVIQSHSKREIWPEKSTERERSTAFHLSDIVHLWSYERSFAPSVFAPWAVIEVLSEICCMCLNQYALTCRDSSLKSQSQPLWSVDSICGIQSKMVILFLLFQGIINIWYVLNPFDSLHYKLAIEGIDQNGKGGKK